MLMATDHLPLAQPAYILRGHSAQIHALHFNAENKRLLTADAEGWVISWNLASKRPAAVWKAHSNAILALGSWGPKRVISHGRDNKLLVWQLAPEEENDLDKMLPVDGAIITNKQPWLLFAMPVNALNFCAFAMCTDDMPHPSSTTSLEGSESVKPILFAVPNAIDSGGIDIFQLPTRKRVAMISADRSTTTGMVMAICLLSHGSRLQVAAGYESGHTMVFVQSDPGSYFERLYSAQPHTQPVLSLAMSPCKDHYITSSADATIAKHPFPCQKGIFKGPLKPIKLAATKHAGQQGLSYRSDGRIFSTAGWDTATRIYSAKTLKEVAVLKWHKEGCFATSFAAVNEAPNCTPESVSGETEVAPESSEIVDSSETSLTVQERRNQIAQSTHWLAVGSKDGKVSLWDIF